MTSRSAACAARRAMCLRDTDPVTVPCTALLLSPPIMDSVIVSTSLTPAEQIDGTGRLSSPSASHTVATVGKGAECVKDSSHR